MTLSNVALRDELTPDARDNFEAIQAYYHEWQRNFLIIGRLLNRCYELGYWRRETSDFHEFVTEQFGISTTNAWRMMGLANLVDTGALLEPDVIDLGIGKAQHLISRVANGTYDHDMIETGKGMSCRRFEKWLKGKEDSQLQDGIRCPRCNMLLSTQWVKKQG
jgi:hypothetical protein